MKKLFIFLFILLSVTLLGQDTEAQQTPVFKNKLMQELFNQVKTEPYQLAYGVQYPVFNITDFSNILKINLSNPAQTANLNAEAIVSYSTDAWYIQDFAEDPFNGIIEYVVGEPLPTPILTLFITSLLAFTLAKYRKLHNKASTQELL
jgi:hypothetical protein